MKIKFKKILSCLLLPTFLNVHLCYADLYFSQEEFEKECVPYVDEYIKLENDSGKHQTKIESFRSIKDGKREAYYKDMETGKTFPIDCFLDTRMKKLIEDNLVPHNGFNLDVNRNEKHMRPLTSLGYNYYDMWRSANEDDLKEIGQTLLKAKEVAEARLQKRSAEIEDRRKKDYERTKFKTSEFFVPQNVKSFFTTTVFTAGAGYLAHQKNKQIKKEHPEKSGFLDFCGLVSTGLAYTCSAFLSNLFTRERPDPLLASDINDKEYQKYLLDVAYKRDAVCDYYAAITGDSKGCSFFDNKTANRKTKSGIPLFESIKKHGVVVTMPKNPFEVWDGYGTIFVNSQSQEYNSAVRDFGKEFVETRDKTKIRYLTKDGIELTQKQLPKT